MAWSELYRILFPKAPYEFHLHGIADLQLGSRSTVESMVEMWIEEILADPFDSGVVIDGDIEDEDRPSTRIIRKAAFACRPEVPERDAEKHMAYLDAKVIPKLLKLQKIKYGIMGIIAGHHWTQLSPVLNSPQYIAQELTRLSGKKVPYCGEMSTFLDLRFISGQGNNCLRKVVHVQHGEGGGSARGAALRKLDRAAQSFIADAYIRGHDCQIEAAKFSQLYPKEKVPEGAEPSLLAKNIATLNLGSATQGYRVTRGPADYPEMGMMRPTEMGFGTLKFKIRRARTWEDPGQNIKADIKVEI